MKRPEIVVFDNEKDLYRRAADEFIVLARRSVEEKGAFAVALSGGKTPLGVYDEIAARAGEIDWPKVHVFWGDERCVPPDSPDSNFYGARSHLIDKVGLPEGNIHRIRGELGPAAARLYEEELRDFFKTPPGAFPSFDLIFLGMGKDGHTASLFPGSVALGEKTALAVAVRTQGPLPTRVTLTPPAIKKAANILFLVKGAEKAETLRRVMDGPHDPVNLPAQITFSATGRCLWLVDRNAAGLLALSREK